nr:MAG TPA: hypothetical protein [Caudoviricetes sp.]
MKNTLYDGNIRTGVKMCPINGTGVRYAVTRKCS